MITSTRAAGLGLIAYGIGTTAGFVGVGAPGGSYEPAAVATYVSSGHMWSAFAFGYLGALSALGLLLFGHEARRLWSNVGERSAKAPRGMCRPGLGELTLPARRRVGEQNVGRL